ncbi:GNAT family N-acetyltransferase [Streptomyces nanshensis]|uniref:BioF2-like acetyltransferase domain-containing protein n=1 Tax=Streptomyces nanshensis TaxID=518642 RepID=A0A1E7L5D2_9ACTN|nr:GNAT family N-acetyltransferase [Streptomyces nanshensis]OEV11406.1 hypothetical protein AN218_13050 [Streptomyces nanshensis]
MKTKDLSPAAVPVREAVRVLAGAEACAFLAVRWPALYEECREATPYQSREWLCGWASQLPAGAQPLVVVCEGAGGPVAALALVREAGVVRALGSPVAECIRPVGRAAEDASVAGALVQELRAMVRAGDAVEVADVPRASALGRHLAGVAGWHGSMVPYARVTLPVIYPAMVPEIRRGHAKRKSRWTRLTQHSRVVVRRSRGPRELLADWEVLLRLHEERFGDLPAAARELRAVLGGCAGIAFIASLTVEDKPVAAQLCLHRRHRAYSLLAAMTADAEICRAGPGHALLRELCDLLHAEGFASFDLGRTRVDENGGGGQVAYKEAYGPGWEDLVTVTSRTAEQPPPRAGRLRPVPPADLPVP